jgi:hypothetical protein
MRDEVLIVPVTRKKIKGLGDRFIVENCPNCGRRHQHGPEPGLRVAHCPDYYPRCTYFLVELNPGFGLRQAAAQFCNLAFTINRVPARGVPPR